MEVDDMNVQRVNPNGTATPYDAAAHRINSFRFAYWKGADLLLVGHLACSFEDLATKAKATGTTVPDGKPDAAGRFWLGKVEAWETTALGGVTTPEDLQPTIAQALGATT